MFASKLDRARNQMALTRRRVLQGGTAIAAAATAGGLFSPRRSRAAGELNVLCWCDHLDTKLIRPFEEAFDVRVNLKDYEGTGVALSILEQSQPGDWDVFVINSPDVPEAAKLGIFAELPEAEFDWSTVFSQLHLPEIHYVDGKLLAVPEKFGYQAIAYNRAQVDPDDMRHVDVMWNPKYQGRIGIQDYYQPVMELIGIGLGIKPSEWRAEHLPVIREKLLKIKEVAALVGDIVTLQTALVAGDVDIIGGGSEYIVSGLASEYPNLDWVVPDEGALLWVQGLSIIASSQRKDLAVEFVKYIVGPEGQARLATSDCYWAMPVNKNAALTNEEKKVLRWDEQPTFLANSHLDVRQEPELDSAMLDLWTEFLSA